MAEVAPQPATTETVSESSTPLPPPVVDNNPGATNNVDPPLSSSNASLSSSTASPPSPTLSTSTPAHQIANGEKTITYRDGSTYCGATSTNLFRQGFYFSFINLSFIITTIMLKL